MNKKILIAILLIISVIKGNAQVEIISTGTGSAYVLNVPAVFPLRNGVQVTFKAHINCTASPTINVTGTGIKNIKKEGGTMNLDSADIKTGQIVTLAYDGTNWQMLSNLGKTSLAGAASGSGTENFVAKWNNPSGTVLGNSAIFDDGVNVGIGTTTPSSQLTLSGMADPLQMTVENQGGSFKTGYRIKTATNEWFVGQETAASGEFRIRHVTPNEVRFEINSTGNIGIGTIFPQTKLHVAGDNPNSIINQVAENSTQGIQSGIIMMRSRGTVAAPTVVGTGDQLGGFYMMGYDGASFGTNGPAAGISAVAAENFSGGTGTDLFISTSNIGATSATTKMIITADGNVGIGTNNTPNQKLEVQDGHILLSNTGTQSELRFKEALANGGQIVSFKAPASLAANVNYTLPIDDGNANDVLVTDGTGVLSWGSASSNAWSLTGNSGTNPVSNFVGTTDNDLVIKGGTGANIRLNHSANTAVHTASQHTFNTSTASSPGVVISGSTNTSAMLGIQKNAAVNTNGVTLGAITFSAAGSAFDQTAIYALRDGASGGTTDVPTALLFYTTLDGTSTSAERMRISNNGNVGIGTTSPGSLFHVNGTARFGQALTSDGSQIWNNTANSNTVTITSGATSASYSLTLPVSQGVVNSVLTNNGSGVLTWSTPASGVTTVSAAAPLSSSGGSSPLISLTGVVPIANGGTNNSSPYTNGSVIFSNGTSLTQNNPAFFWDNTNTRLGIGTTSPAEKLQVVNNAVTTDNSAVSVLGGTTGRAGYFMGSSTNTYSGAIQYDNSNNSMNFWTNNTINRLVITNAGNIGVSTATPATKIHSRGDLQIEDPGNSSGVVFNMATLGDGINPVNATGTKGWQWLAYGNGNGTAALQNDMRLTWYNGTGTLPFLYFDNTGKLGVNLPAVTDQPVYDLDVAGTIRSGFTGRDGQLRIYSEQGATDFEASFSPPAAMTQNTAYLLPPDDGNANDVLTSNGSGTLTWTPVSALGISGAGTTNYSARWISSTQIGTGAIQDNGTNAGIGVAPGFGKLDVAGEILSIDGTAGQSFTIRRANLHRWTLKETGTTGLQFVQIYNDASTSLNTSRLDIADNGNIGIGTSTPVELLTLSAIDADIDAETYSTTESSSLHVKRARGTSATPAVPLSGDYFGGVGFQAWDGSAFQEGARVQGVIDGTPAAGDMPGRLEFWTSLDGTASAIERMRIANSGNVGIGTTAPGTSRLNVVIPSSDAVNPIGLTVTNNYTGTASKFGIDVNVDGAGSGIKYGISSSVVGLSGDASTNYGYQVAMTPNGSGSVYGFYGSMSQVGTGQRFGIYNTSTAASTNTSSVYGIYNTASKPTGSTGIVYGIVSNSNHNGTGTSYGVYSSNSGTAASRYGLYVTGETDNYFSSNVGIGTTAPSYPLDVTYNQAAYIANFNNTNGGTGADGILIKLNQTTPDVSAYYVGCYSGAGLDGGIRGDGAGGVSFANLSDRRLKQNIKNFDNTLSIIDKIQPAEYEMIKAPGKKQYGFIAQDLQLVYPSAVMGSPDSDVKTDPMTVDYSKLTPLLTGGIKELHQIVKSQDLKIKTLEQQLEELKKQIELLQKK